MCGIDLIALCVIVVILVAVFLVVQKLPFLAPFRDILNIVIAVIATIFVLVRVLSPLLSCAV